MKTSTTNEIILKQNEPEFIELLKAQRAVYSQNSRLPTLKKVEILISIILPYIILLIPTLESFLSIGGIILIVLYYATKWKIKNKNEVAAKIQEQFDTKVYGINWSEISCVGK